MRSTGQAAAGVMADEGVKDIATVVAGWSTGADDLLDLIDAIATPVAVAGKAIAAARQRRCSGFTTLAPDHRPVQRSIDAGELTDGRVERVAGDRQRLVGAPEQLGCDLLAVDLQREFPIQCGAVRQVPRSEHRRRMASPPHRYRGRARGRAAPRSRSSGYQGRGNGPGRWRQRDHRR